MRLLFLLLSFIIVSSCASSSREARQREELLENKQTENVTTSEINAYPEIYLANESALQELNTTQGIVEDAYFTGNDEARFALGYNFSLDFESLSKVQSFDFIYSSRISESYRMYWWSVHFQNIAAKYNAIANESESNPEPTRADSDQSLTVFGLGIGHRFRALAGTMSERYFETVNAFGNYVSHSDASTKDRYQGYGYSAEYTLHYRAGERLTYGVKFSYNWALVDREKENDDEKLAARSLVFGWSTLGLELGYYF